MPERQLYRSATRWAARGPHDAEGRGALLPLYDDLAAFCRAMHARGVHGPYVRRRVADVLRDALSASVASPEARDRTVRDAQGLVDVIYLNGEHLGA